MTWITTPNTGIIGEQTKLLRFSPLTGLGFRRYNKEKCMRFQ